MNVTYSSVKSLSNLGSLLINWDKGDNSTVIHDWTVIAMYRNSVLSWETTSLGPYIAISDAFVLTLADNADIAERPSPGSIQTDKS